MKKFVVTLLVVIALLGGALAITINMLQASQRELDATKTELETRKDIWWKLWSLSNTYYNGLTMTIPNYNDEGAPRPIVIRDNKWLYDAKYEFSNDGKTAKVYVHGQPADWSYKPTTSQ